MKCIVAVDKKWGIGRNNDLLFSLPADMKHFRETTKGKVVVMGLRTLKSFPNGAPLKNRVNVVLSDVDIEQDDGVIVCRSVDELRQALAPFNTDTVYIIGGGMMYRQFCDCCDEAIVTKVDADGEATVFFPNLDEKENWYCDSVSEPVETNGHTVRFCYYKNRNIKAI